jgi:hypothetical protein
MKSSMIIIVFFIGDTIANLNPRIREEKYIGTLEDYDICLNDLSFYSTKENRDNTMWKFPLFILYN